MKQIGYFLSDIGYWLRLHSGRVAVVLAVLTVGLGAALALSLTTADEAGPGATRTVVTSVPAPPSVVAEEPEPERPAELGFPAFATRNTTRIAAADSAAAAAGAALAAFPSVGAAPGPDAVSIVDSEDWTAGLAAAALVADPVGAPILVSDGGELPGITAAALEELDPQGSKRTGGSAVFRFGAAAEAPGREAFSIAGDDPAAVAAAAAQQRERLTGERPGAVIVVSSEEPQYAMPAAGWAARSGDPILFTGADELPAPTATLIERLGEDVPVFVLGPPEVISDAVVKQLERAGGPVERIGVADPIANAIEFARYTTPDGFGWNINDPGHGFVLVSAERPLDAAAAAPLSATGTWGPTLLFDDPAVLPEALGGYLLDLKPGYVDDPTRAVYNHIWLIGDEATASVELQAQADEIAEAVPVRSGSGDALLEGGSD